MKKIIALLLIVLTVLLCGCNEKTAESFDSEPVDNAYNNRVAGGKMAYSNGSYYISYDVSFVNLGVFRLNNDGAELIYKVDEESTVEHAVNSPYVYQYSNDVYVSSGDKLFIYDEAENKLTDTDFDYPINRDYYSEDLRVYYSDEAQSKLSVKYKENKEYTLDERVTSFYVYNDIIYLLNDDYWLYSNDPSKCDEDCEFISYLTEDSYKIFIICDNYCYFDYTGNEYDGEGLYRYSLENDKLELVKNCEVNGVNSYDNKLYFTSDKGIYVDDINGNPEKLSGFKATELYILDKDWIYAVDDENGKIKRISFDGSVTEKIDFTIKNK